MHEYFDILKRIKLFDKINDEDLTFLLTCLNAAVTNHRKDEFILIAGDKPEGIGILLTGSAQVIKEDLSGERIVVASLDTGSLFAEALCCANVAESPVSVVASSNTAIMRIATGKILHTCTNICTFHSILIENLLCIIAEKNLMLQSRLDFIGKKTLRQKIGGYLEFQAQKQGRKSFLIPFNREELADFLCVDRSALSHELSKMKNDGIIEYRKNRFKLLK